MREEFASVYDEEVGSVYGFFAYRLASVFDAEDLTQRTFERALRGWQRFDPERAPARVWLQAIARNLLIDHYRADGSARHQDIEMVSEGQLPTVLPEPDLGIEPELATALAEMTPREREILALRFGGGLTGPEIAELTGFTLANVQQILSRSLRRMRARLDDGELRRGRAG